MSKLVNKYSLGITLAVSVALVAVYQSDSTIEDVGEQIALKLIEILPRKHNIPAQRSIPTASSSSNASVDVEEEPLFSKLSSFDPVGHYNAKEAMQKRYEGLREQCIKMSDFMRPERLVSEAIPKKESLLLHPSSEMMMCPLDQVAAKTMNTFFTRIREPGNEYENKIKSFKINFPRSANGLKRAIVVRHPLERLVSAYRHNFERSFNAATNEEEGGEISFVEFVDIVLNGHAEYQEFLEENNIVGESVAIDTGMIDGEGLSRAWNPFWRQCGLCNPDFQPHFILHLDHFKEDSAVLVEMMGRPKNSGDFVSVSMKAKSGLREVEEHYWSQLTKGEIRALHDKYKIDHDLFGFSPDYYIAMGQDDE